VFFSFPVGFKSITTQRRLAAGRAHLPACHAGPVLRVMEPLGASRFPKCDSILYTNLVWIYLDYHR
jgi:hypothetical protein